MTSHRLAKDATNRTVRTFLQGIGFAVLAAVVMVLYPVFTGARTWSDFHWSLLGFSLVQAVGTAILAYIMRAFLDHSRIPTPTPPNEAGHVRVVLAAAVTAVLTLVLAVVALAPAQADHPELDQRWNKCINVGEGATACMEVYGHYTGGVGITINHVYIETFGKDFVWENKTAACSNVRMWNQNDVVAWRKDGAECDIYKPSMNRLYTPSVEANQATSLTVGWTFSPKLNNAPDPGSQHISITL